MKRKLEFKKDPWVIVPYTLFVVMAFTAFFLKYIDWKQLGAFLTGLNLPAVFGLKKMMEDAQGDVPDAVPTRPELPDAGPDSE